MGHPDLTVSNFMGNSICTKRIKLARYKFLDFYKPDIYLLKIHSVFLYDVCESIVMNRNFASELAGKQKGIIEP